MRFSKRSGFAVLCLTAIAVMQPSCFAAELSTQTGKLDAIRKQIPASATVDDICSNGPSSFMRDLGPNKPIEACIIGDTVIYQMKDGQKKTSVEGERGLPGLIMSGMYTNFKNKRGVVGQANLTLRIDSERNYHLLSQTIYVPGCAPYHGGAEIPQAAKEFCDQVKSAIETVPLTELTTGNRDVEWMSFEVVLGRDPEVFPRYGTRFNGIFKANEDGNGGAIRY